MSKIIDGVDVAECSYYNKDNAPYCCEIWDNECEAQLCYYKQLKRSLADATENWKLRKALEEIKEMVNEPCVPSEKDCLTCPTSCFTKDILIKINKVLE